MPEFPLAAPVTVVAKVPAGAFEITAEERASADVDVQPYDDSDKSRELAERTRVEQRGDVLTIAAPDTSGRLWQHSGRIRVRVRVPVDSTARISTASAEVTCHGRYATMAVDSASGDVYVEHVTGDASFRMASGDVRALRVDGQLQVKGASGDVTAQHTGGQVAAKVASGRVEIQDAGAGVRVKTASGGVRIGTARHGAIRIGTASGDVGIGVQPGTGVWLDLSTVSGSTRNELDMGGAPPATGQDLSLEVRTVSGDIDVHRAN
jgi:DUF4097 and DUF4098 domain-containing protein YvlB